MKNIFISTLIFVLIVSVLTPISAQEILEDEQAQTNYQLISSALALLLMIMIFLFAYNSKKGLAIRLKLLKRNIEYNTKKGYYVKASRQTKKAFNIQKKLDDRDY